MPKILSINNYHYRRGGSDVVYLDHAELMESEGWSNALFFHAPPYEFYDPLVRILRR